jgi:DTW domain-containing protein YfiP
MTLSYRKIPTDTRLILVINAREARKATNTGLLAAAALASSEVHVVGAYRQPVDFPALFAPDRRNLVLFPTGASVDVSTLPPAPSRLIVPDGDWSQAARIRRKLPDDAQCQFVHLPAAAPSEFRLRRRTGLAPEALATIEAVARALGLLDGEAIERELLRVFREFQQRYLAARS